MQIYRQFSIYKIKSNLFSIFFMKAIDRLYKYIDYKGIKAIPFEKEIGLSNGYLGKQLKRGADLGEGILIKIIENCPEINPEWLLVGNGEMLKSEKDPIVSHKKNMIPLYEDVQTIGGMQQTASLEPVYNSSVEIDAGGWFNGATAAIRHYGDSMVEYESGCTLVIRELIDKNEIIWGRNYVVETDEMRITKKIANYDDNHIMCYSTNYDTYPDGALIHQPIKINKEKIRQLSRVLGSVNKEESTGKVALVGL